MDVMMDAGSTLMCTFPLLHLVCGLILLLGREARKLRAEMGVSTDGGTRERMVYDFQNPIKKWMMTGGTPILGKPHIMMVMDQTTTFLHVSIPTCKLHRNMYRGWLLLGASWCFTGCPDPQQIRMVHEPSWVSSSPKEIAKCFSWSTPYGILVFDKSIPSFFRGALQKKSSWLLKVFE